MANIATKVIRQPSDITLDTTVGELQEAIDGGYVTLDDWKAQLPRIQAEKEAREAGRLAAIEIAKRSEARKRPRTAKWTSRFIIGGDGWRGYLVTCGLVAWHVDEGTFAVRKIR
jgi:hypothetical protein